MRKILSLVVLCGFLASGASCKHAIIDRQQPIILSPLIMVVSPGETAMVTAMYPPGTKCSIQFATPSGEMSKAVALGDKTSDESSRVSWRWTIDPNMSLGNGTVVVTCRDRSATAKIRIE